ncbi:MAG: hypothetical protein IKT33_00865 [Clostridia bacterium]|nr:hypothetical protein [Clostridia bacterium]
MKSTIIKILALLVGLGIVIAAGLGLYLNFTGGKDTTSFQFGTEYHMTEMRSTDLFKGMQMNTDSYFKINEDKQTGILYLVGLEASSETIPFIVTKFEELKSKTIIHIDYIIYSGNDTHIQSLNVIYTNNSLEIKNVESHGVQDIIQQNPIDIKHLDYEVTIIKFAKEAA